MRPLVTLFAVLFAVFAMHGLASHDRAHGGDAVTALPVVAGDGFADPRHGHGTTAPDNPDAGEQSPDHDLGGGVCLALLGLFAALLALVLRKVLDPRSLFALRRVAVGLLPPGRAADPPCLHRLSIMRC